MTSENLAVDIRQAQERGLSKLKQTIKLLAVLRTCTVSLLMYTVIEWSYTCNYKIIFRNVILKYLYISMYPKKGQLGLLACISPVTIVVQVHLLTFNR